MKKIYPQVLFGRNGKYEMSIKRDFTQRHVNPDLGVNDTA